MKQDQIERLRILQADLAEVFIEEADPKNWPGADVDSKDMTQQNRGDRYWSKKNAVATLAIVCRISSLIDVGGPKGGGPNGGEDKTLEEEQREAEKEANALLARLHGGVAPKKPRKKANAQK